MTVERDYEPSRMARKSMANSYEILIPTAKADPNRGRLALLGKESGRHQREAIGAGGSQ